MTDVTAPASTNCRVLAAWRCSFARLGNDSGELRVILTDASLREVFNPLVSDIAAAAHAEPSAAVAVLAAVGRFARWRQMLQNLAASGLVPRSRRGLFGELVFLSDHLLPSLPVSEAIRAWTGPAGAHQDFQLPHAAIEVKTSAGKETPDPRCQQRARA